MNTATKHILRETKEWVDAILKEKHWTGTDLARKCHIAPSAILKFLNGEHQMPPKDIMMKISDVSGKPIPSSIMDRL